MDSDSEEEEFLPPDREVEEDEDEDWKERDEGYERYLQSQSLLWLLNCCERGTALWKFEKLRHEEEDGHENVLKEQVFEQDTYGRFPLSVALFAPHISGDETAYKITIGLVEYAQNFPGEGRQMLLATWREEKTALHWAAWGNATEELLYKIAIGAPEALLLKDEAGRTPFETLKRYFSSSPKLDLLKRLELSWRRHVFRSTLYLSVIRYFVTQPTLIPFHREHSKRAGIKSQQSWFYLSVMGSLMQREMKPLVIRILNYVDPLLEKKSVTTATSTAKPNPIRRSTRKRNRETRDA